MPPSALTSRKYLHLVCTFPHQRISVLPATRRKTQWINATPADSSIPQLATAPGDIHTRFDILDRSSLRSLRRVKLFWHHLNQLEPGPSIFQHSDVGFQQESSTDCLQSSTNIYTRNDTQGGLLHGQASHRSMLLEKASFDQPKIPAL